MGTLAPDYPLLRNIDRTRKQPHSCGMQSERYRRYPEAPGRAPLMTAIGDFQPDTRDLLNVRFGSLRS